MNNRSIEKVNFFLGELLRKVYEGKRKVTCKDRDFYVQLSSKERKVLGLGTATGAVSVNKLIAMFILKNPTRLAGFYHFQGEYYSFLTEQEQPYFEGKTQVSLTELKRFAQL